ESGRDLPGGQSYVQPCGPAVAYCSQIRVSAGLDAAAATAKAACCPGVSIALLDAIDSDDDDDPDQQCSSVALLPSVPPASGAAMDLYSAIDPIKLLSSSESSSSEGESESDDDDDDDDDKQEEGRSDHRSKDSIPVLAPWDNGYLSVEQVDAIIRSDLERLEAKKPWRFVFRCPDVPFAFKREDDPFDVFFMRWDLFWYMHGRAVWERGFWQPLLPGSIEAHRRKNRQIRAMRAFRELATDLLARLGEPFHRRLARVLHDGWWYRTEPFALRRLFYRSRRMYEEYLVRRARARWPRGRKFLMERRLQPVWWLTDIYGGA
ncbi:hypothetical protein BBJ28_00023677, partial [Nothophytophthora sp. Chile5]